MKKVFFVLIAMLVLLLSSVHAQPEGEMTGEHNSEMFHGHEIMGEMMHNIQKMNGVMQKMVGVMQRKTDHGSMERLSEIIDMMSRHLKQMSEAMKRGEVSEDELKGLHEQMRKIEKRVDILQLW